MGHDLLLTTTPAARQQADAEEGLVRRPQLATAQGHDTAEVAEARIEPDRLRTAAIAG